MKTYAVIDTDTGQLISISTEQPAPNKSRILTHLQFMRLFTDAELQGIYAAEKGSVALEVWLDKFRVADEINLDDPEISGGVRFLESVGLLGVGRSTEVLA